MSTVQIAASGDIHCGACDGLAETVRDVAGRVDAFLLAGDLTTHGEPEQAAVLVDAFGGVEVPVLAVLGNHDWHVNRRDELVTTLQDGGITVLDPGHHVFAVDDIEVGVAGAKGFMGGFPGSHLPDFGEPLLREVYAESLREAEAIEAGLRAIQTAHVRIVLLHYAPCTDTLMGEPEPIWTFLGTDRLAPPIIQHEPDLVLHGHAHAGTYEGALGNVRVLNVSTPVTGQLFVELELEATAPAVH